MGSQLGLLLLCWRMSCVIVFYLLYDRSIISTSSGDEVVLGLPPCYEVVAEAEEGFVLKSKASYGPSQDGFMRTVDAFPKDRLPIV